MGMKRKELVKKIVSRLSVPKSTAYGWLNGNRTPDVKTAIKISKVTGLPFEAWENINKYINEKDYESKTATEYKFTGVKGVG